MSSSSGFALRAEHDALGGRVERILSARRADPLACPSRDGRQADTRVLACLADLSRRSKSAKAEAARRRKREIDQRVYRLYALTPDEIKLVEESAK